MDKFDGKLEFDITLIPYEGSDTWVENTLGKIHQYLNLILGRKLIQTMISARIGIQLMRY